MNVKRAVPDTGTSRDHVTFSGQVSLRAKTPLPDSHLVHTDRNVADHDILATSLHLPEVCFTTATTTDGQEYEANLNQLSEVGMLANHALKLVSSGNRRFVMDPETVHRSRTSWEMQMARRVPQFFDGLSKSLTAQGCEVAPHHHEHEIWPDGSSASKEVVQIHEHLHKPRTFQLESDSWVALTRIHLHCRCNLNSHCVSCSTQQYQLLRPKKPSSSTHTSSVRVRKLVPKDMERMPRLTHVPVHSSTTLHSTNCTLHFSRGRKTR